MALLDTINEIQKRRDRVINRRQNQFVAGEQPAGMPVPKEKLRAAMSYLDQLHKENRMQAQKQIEQQNKMTQAMQLVNQQEQQQQAPQPQQQQAPAPQAPQMTSQPLMDQRGSQAPQQQQMPAQGLLGMPRQ